MSGNEPPRRRSSSHGTAALLTLGVLILRRHISSSDEVGPAFAPSAPTPRLFGRSNHDDDKNKNNNNNKFNHNNNNNKFNHKNNNNNDKNNRLRRTWRPALGEGPEAARELLSLLDAEASVTGRGSGLSAAERRRVFELAEELQALESAARRPGGCGSQEAPLAGTWRLLFQGAEGPEVSASSPDSWKSYFAGEGPSPLQNLVTTDTSSVGSVFQSLELVADSAGASSGTPSGGSKLRSPLGGSFVNLIDFSPTGCLEISASLE
ncbi:unnamed protein product, partial [Polarella glacialis]